MSYDNHITMQQEAAYKELYGLPAQYRCTADERYCYIGNAPTIRRTVDVLGYHFTLGFVDMYICDLTSFIKGRRYELPVHQDISALIVSQYSTLKVTEFVLFCVKCKAGMLGKFYATIEPMDILSRLSEFSAEAMRLRKDYYYQYITEKMNNEDT